MFSLLRHVQIILAVQHKHDDKILYLVSLLRAAPFVEHLEVHVSILYCRLHGTIFVKDSATVTFYQECFVLVH